MIRISNIKLSLDSKEDIIKVKILKKLKINENELIKYKIFKQSLDARKKNNIHFIYIVDVLVKNEKKLLNKIKDKDITITPDYSYKYQSGKVILKNNPIIVGFGPSGLFCALIMAELGLKPIVFERGEDIDTRKKSVKKFWNTGILNTESNVQFGEGGAGTFSDGKLTTRIKNSRCRKVLEEFVKAGAPEDILYSYSPHIGTDILSDVVKNIREKIKSLGGQVFFNSKLTDIIIKENKIRGIKINDNFVETENLILAIGHSARDTFEMIYKNKIDIEQKPFAMGLRIEHKQKSINFSQYGDENLANLIGAANYKLTYTTKKGRGVYTFCMCPGGYVVASSSEKNHLCINGMSYHSRSGENSNSALLVQIFPQDFESDHPLAGMYLQREIEKKAFINGGGNYNAPTQLLGDFLNKKVSKSFKDIKPTYKPDVKFSDMDNIFPEFMTEALREAIIEMGKKLKGFDYENAVLTAVEARSSSPIRILRDNETLESIKINGLYPAGEGAGYAGGIISAAVDGIMIAEKVFEKNKI